MTKIKITKEKLENLYLNQELSTRDIAKQLNVGQTTIRRWLAKYNIKTRSTKEAMKTTVFLEKQKVLAERYKIEYTQDITKFCEYCGREFHVNGSHKKIKYCSKECSKKLFLRNLRKILVKNYILMSILVNYAENSFHLNILENILVDFVIIVCLNINLTYLQIK